MVTVMYTFRTRTQARTHSFTSCTYTAFQHKANLSTYRAHDATWRALSRVACLFSHMGPRLIPSERKQAVCNAQNHGVGRDRHAEVQVIVLTICVTFVAS
jgi:hypothetical protein